MVTPPRPTGIIFPVGYYSLAGETVHSRFSPAGPVHSYLVCYLTHGAEALRIIAFQPLVARSLGLPHPTCSTVTFQIAIDTPLEFSRSLLWPLYKRLTTFAVGAASFGHGCPMLLC